MKNNTKSFTIKTYIAYGFSLIELLIVIAIVGILTCIAYPSYSDHLIKVHRATAIVALTDLAARLENYYGDHQAYTGATVENLAAQQAHLYQLEIANTTENSYLIKAIPTQKQAKDKCGILILDQLGNKTSSSGNDDCWID